MAKAFPRMPLYALLLLVNNILIAGTVPGYLHEEDDDKDIPYFYVQNCDKDGGIVGARVASALGGVAETRTLQIDSDQNIVGKDYLETRCGQTCEYYKQAGLGFNPLLMGTNVVMGSVHRLGLYLAETLHAPFLPLQFLGFAPSFREIEETNGLTIAMSDYGVHNRLWVWCKISERNHIPAPYIQMLTQAEHLFVVRSTETEGTNSFVGKYNGCYVHSSAISIEGHPYPRQLVEDLQDQGLIEDLPEAERLALRQHEWGLPDSTIKAMKRLWKNVLHKPIQNFHLIEGGTVPLYCTIPTLWESYLQSNRRPVLGMTCNAYWVSHPSYEREFGLIPFHFYRFKDSRGGWLPFDDLILAVTGRHWQNQSPFLVRSFVNNIGSGPGEFSDVEELKRFLEANKLWASNPNINGYFCIGYDCTGAQCTSYEGEVLDDIPSTKVRKWLTDATQRVVAAMQPLGLGMIIAVTSSAQLYKQKIMAKL